MTETTEATAAERFHFVSLEDALIARGAVETAAAHMAELLERYLEDAANAFGTNEYERLIAVVNEGMALFHRTRHLFVALRDYIDSKWGEGHKVPDPFAAYQSERNNQRIDSLMSMLFDSEEPSPDGMRSQYPFGMIPDVADGNDPDAPIHGPEDETS